MAMLSEKCPELGVVSRGSKSRWSDVKKQLEAEARYKAVEGSSTREDYFREYCKGLPHEEHSDASPSRGDKDPSGGVRDRDKEERERAARKAREKEVAAELAGELKLRDKESEKHKYAEAEQAFKALLSDMVKSADAVWRDTRRSLRKDARYESADALDKEGKERLFDEHVGLLDKKRRELLAQVCDELKEVDLGTTWKHVKKQIRDDARVTKLYPEKDRRVEKEFDDYMRSRLNRAKAEFKELLKETKIITHKSKQMITENEQHLKDILATLENDQRYLVLNCTPDERERLLEGHLDELAKRGPPPPPTQQDPAKVRAELVRK